MDIIGGSDEFCSADLAKIKIETDSPIMNSKTGKLEITCQTGDDDASTRFGNRDTPVIILCLPALFHGNIESPLKDPENGDIIQDGVDCDSISTHSRTPKPPLGQRKDRVTYRMTTLGAILLHEYT